MSRRGSTPRSSRRDCSANALVREFGTTEDWHRANWVLSDGRMVPRDGRDHHAQATVVCPQEDSRKVAHMLVRSGAMRLTGVGPDACGKLRCPYPAVDLARRPTDAQRRVLREMVQEANRLTVSVRTLSRRTSVMEFGPDQERDMLRAVAPLQVWLHFDGRYGLEQGLR